MKSADRTLVENQLQAAQSAPTAQPTASLSVPGSFETKPTSVLLDECRVGWTAFSSLPNPGDEANALSMSPEALSALYQGTRSQETLPDDVIEKFLSEAYYGEWYHHTGFMLFTVFFTWLVTKLGGGLMACLVIGAFLATYHQTNMRRLRRNTRDDINREMSINRLETDEESVDWMNHFLSRFWLIYEPVLSAQIIGTADAILVESTPSFLDSIRLSTFTLGTKAPRIDGIKTYPRTEPNVVCMDWKLSFIPNDIMDLSKRDLQSKVNPKIVLTIRVGKGMLGAGMPILLEDLAFSGTLRLKFKLFNEFPHVKTVEASFLDKPVFDYVLKPVGGDTFGFDINNIPGLQSFVQEQVHATLGPMMYAPNNYLVDVAGMMAGGVDLDAANGVLGLTLYSANNLKGSDLFGSLDPYVTFHIGNTMNTELGRTAAFEDTSDPKWDETHFLLINTLSDNLCLQVMDRNVGRKDTLVGVAMFDLKELLEQQAEGLTLTVTRNGKSVGDIKCDLRYFPISQPEKQEDGTVVPVAESNSGVLRFLVHECKELGNEKKGFGLPLVGSSDTNAYAIAKVNGVEKLRTMVFKRSVNPRWYKWVEMFVADKTKLNLSVDVMDSNEFTDDVCLGRFSSRLVDIEEQITKQGQDWWTLKDGIGKIHLGAVWKPVVMTGFSEGLGHGTYRPPIGVVRIEVLEAKDLKNVEALTGGKSDPYVRVLSGTQVRGQTEYIDDNLDPVWDTCLYVPVHSLREDLILEVMDYNDIQKDKFLGLTELVLKDIVKEVKVEEQSVYEAMDTVDRWTELLSNDRKKSKGSLHYVASFFPTLELAQQAKTPKDTETVEGTPAPETPAPETPAPETPATDMPLPLPEKDVHGELIQYTQDKSKINLLAYESGILKVTIHSASIKDKAKVTADIMLDSNDPQYKTAQIKGSHLPFNETADAFVKEMDFSRLMVRIKTVSDSKDDSNLGFWISPVSDLVRQIQNRSAEDDTEKEYPLSNSNGGTIRLSFDFIPVVKFKLDPKESLENQGNLTVTAIKANNLKGVDRSGTSDPYVVFTFNGEKVHKTDTYKKQLSPVFKNEVFTVPVLQRIGTSLVAEVYDWDQIGKDELLGQCTISFTADQVESFAAREVELPLNTEGSIRVRLLWQPQLLARKRTGTSIFSATTRMFTSVPGAGGKVLGAGIGAGGKVLGAGIGAGGKVLGGGVSVIGGGVSAIGGGIGSGVSAIGGGIGGGVSAIGGGIGSGIRGIGKLGGSKKPSPSEIPPVPSVRTQSLPTEPAMATPTPEITRSNTSMHGSTMEPTLSSESNTPYLGRPSEDSIIGSNGTITISVVGARNLKAMDRGGTSDPYARVRIGTKVIGKTKHIKKTLVPEWNETFSTKVGSAKTVLDFKVKDHNTINDVDIGEVAFDLWDNVRPGQPFDGWLTLKPEGTGEIHIRVEQSNEGNSNNRGLFGKIL
ncbi:C2 domain-containing protein [Spinellus fusiger]|nr:C2 domain-containing protein [Spinellus fusiger]